MSHAYAAVSLPIVFPAEKRDELAAYIGAIAKNLGLRLLKGNAKADELEIPRVVGLREGEQQVLTSG
jgi:hypothetical protein